MFFPLKFIPLPGFSSPHLQTIMACMVPSGPPPPSTLKLIDLDDGDALCCEISTPPNWKNTHKTVVMLHGLGGCQKAGYMVRLSRKLFKAGIRAVRVSMRSSGSGKKYAKLPYHGGLTSDIYTVLKVLYQATPLSPFILIGYSLGGNIALKLTGELGEEKNHLLKLTIAVCPPVDLAETARLMNKPANLLYNRYYMYNLDKQTKAWTKGVSFSSVYEFDKIVTAPHWGFESPEKYYELSSSRHKLRHVSHPCHILFAEDDPFINYQSCLESERSEHVKIWLSKYGGHMGFIGWADKQHSYYWLDRQLLDWIKDLI